MKFTNTDLYLVRVSLGPYLISEPNIFCANELDSFEIPVNDSLSLVLLVLADMNRADLSENFFTSFYATRPNF